MALRNSTVAAHTRFKTNFSSTKTPTASSAASFTFLIKERTLSPLRWKQDCQLERTWSRFVRIWEVYRTSFN